MNTDINNKVVLITGGARRVGAAMCRFLHSKGCNIALHYHKSEQEALKLADELNQQRANSVYPLQADLNDIYPSQLELQQGGAMASERCVLDVHGAHETSANTAAASNPRGMVAVENLIDECLHHFKRLDCIINNASTFFATPIGTTTLSQWQDLFGTNVTAPFFLCQKAAPALSAQQGCIINIIDIHASQPMKNYSVYCMAKAALAMLTKSLAKELGPKVRVNGIAPGAIMWPEQDNSLSTDEQAEIIEQTALKRVGNAEDIAKTAYFLLTDAPYITGQIIAVDGGRSLGGD